MDDKAFDLVAFNRSAERAFIALVGELCRSGPQPVGVVLAECAYGLDVSTETVKRYLAKYSSRFGPLHVEKGLVSLRGSSLSGREKIPAASPCSPPPSAVSPVSAGFALADVGVQSESGGTVRGCAPAPAEVGSARAAGAVCCSSCRSDEAGLVSGVGESEACSAASPRDSGLGQEVGDGVSSVHAPSSPDSLDSLTSRCPFSLSDVQSLLAREGSGGLRGLRLTTEEAVARYLAPSPVGGDAGGGGGSPPVEAGVSTLPMFSSGDVAQGGRDGALWRASFQVDWSRLLMPDGRRRRRPRPR